jgi:hypothetical protein
VADALERSSPTRGWNCAPATALRPGADRFITQMGEFLTLVGLAAW